MQAARQQKRPRGAKDKFEPKQTLRFSNRYGAMPSQPQLQVSLYVGPFVGKYAVKNRVARRAVAARRMMPDDAVFLRAQSLNRPLRSQIENVSPQADHLATQRIEGMAQQQKFAGRVHAAALPAPGVPRITDFDAIDRGRDVVVARAPDDLAGG